MEDGVLVEVLQEQGLDVVREVGVGALRVDDLPLVERERLRLGLVVLLQGDVARGEHAVEDRVAALDGGLGVLGGVVVGRRLRQAHEQRGLGQGQVLGVLVEVGDGGGLDAVGGVAVVDGVEVHHQDLFLGVRLLHLDGDVGLAHLALEDLLELLVREDRVAHELLRDGGRALGAAAEGHEDRADDALRVDAVVLVEADVLGVHRALEHVGGDLVFRHAPAVLQVVLGDHVVVGVVDLRRLGNQVGVGRVVVRQVLQPRVDERADRDGECDEE